MANDYYGFASANDEYRYLVDTNDGAYNSRRVASTRQNIPSQTRAYSNVSIAELRAVQINHSSFAARPSRSLVLEPSWLTFMVPLVFALCFVACLIGIVVFKSYILILPLTLSILFLGLCLLSALFYRTRW
jgi:hypothetical protein